jgi:hypothetical protein
MLRLFLGCEREARQGLVESFRLQYLLDRCASRHDLVVSVSTGATDGRSADFDSLPELPHVDRILKQCRHMGRLPCRFFHDTPDSLHDTDVHLRNVAASLGPLCREIAAASATAQQHSGAPDPHKALGQVVSEVAVWLGRVDHVRQHRAATEAVGHMAGAWRFAQAGDCLAAMPPHVAHRPVNA